MAYFLKKSSIKKGVYLQIYESFYHRAKKQTAQKSYQSLGYLDELVASGIEDPVAHFSAVVKEMNKERKLKKQQESIRQIAASPEKYVGYFLLKALFDKLDATRYFDLLQLTRDFRFSIANLVELLVYSQVIDPCSKSAAVSVIFPSLFDCKPLSYEQVMEGTCYIGSEYEKVIEIMNHQRAIKYPTDTSTTYFDGTNFYFEIDREDKLRRNGPSKENRKSPIVGMGLLLDAHQVPIGMKLYPGNESEKPQLRRIIQDLKKRNNITGRTVQVADKGLNCAANILAARKDGDGYLFSKSVKILPATEKTWLLMESGYRDVLDSEGKLLYKLKSCVDKFPYDYVDDNGKKTVVMLTEKRVASFNPCLAEKKRYEINRMVEKARSLTASRAKKSEFGESGKYVVFSPADKKGKPVEGEVVVSINSEAIEEDLRLAGYNLFVTSETKMKAEDVHATYRNLWRIEESFKVMKSYLDARPAFVQKQHTIYGHFLICYLSVFLLRILQFYVFENRYRLEQIIKLIKSFKVVETQQDQFVNLLSSSACITNVATELDLPLTNFYLTTPQIKKMLNLKLKP